MRLLDTPTRASDLTAGPAQLARAASAGRAPAHQTLATLPTPVERTPGLDAGRTRVWVKRDDLASSLYGGNKARKLEYLLADPTFPTRGPVVSAGGIGSHHLVALALYLRRQSRPLHALVFDQPVTPFVRDNLATIVSSGAQLWHARSRVTLPAAWLRHRLGRHGAASIPPGGSSAAGCLGFVAAGLELAAQVRAGAVPAPSRIYVACGTAGTSAGLAVGLAWAGLPTQVRLVSVVERLAFNRATFLSKVGTALGAIRATGAPVRGGPARALREAGVEWSIDHSATGRGYGVPTAEAWAAVARAREAGLSLEPVYTGKSLAALHHAETRDDRARDVLWWNTYAGVDLTPHIAPDWRARLPFPLGGVP